MNPHLLLFQAVGHGAMYKGQRLNMAWQTPDGKTIPASPTVLLRPQLSPIALDSRTVNSAGLDDLDSTTSPIGTHLGLLEVGTLD